MAFRYIRCISTAPNHKHTCVQWHRFTDTKHGYTHESQPFLNLVEVLLEMEADERKGFLQFATGCPTLPPGGLANLDPRLTVVRKTESGSADMTLPSVNTYASLLVCFPLAARSYLTASVFPHQQAPRPRRILTHSFWSSAGSVRRCSAGASTT